MGLFVDPKETKVIYFGADCEVDDLKPNSDTVPDDAPDPGREGQHWLRVRKSLNEGEWQLLTDNASYQIARSEVGEMADESAVAEALSIKMARRELDRMAMWIDDCSFLPSHLKYPKGSPTRGLWDRRVQIFKQMEPPAAAAVRTLLDKHIEKAWGERTAEEDETIAPKASVGAKVSLVPEASSTNG